MALRATMLRTAGVNSSLRRFVHITARPAPLDSVVNRPTAASQSLILPENENSSNMFPNSPFIWGSMELMAVPKKKVSPHKRGIRNGPKALKPVPVIIRWFVVELNCHISFVAVGLSRTLVKRTILPVDQIEGSSDIFSSCSDPSLCGRIFI